MGDEEVSKGQSGADADPAATGPDPAQAPDAPEPGSPDKGDGGAGAQPDTMYQE